MREKYLPIRQFARRRETGRYDGIPLCTFWTLSAMIPRTLFNADHETFRDSVRRFMKDEVMPHDERWMEQGYVDRKSVV